MQLAVQCFTLRDALAQDLWGTFAKVREIGLEYVELAGFYDQPATEFAARLADLDLRVCGSHLGLDSFENDLDQVVKDHLALGCHNLTLPWISDEVVAQGWPAFAQRCEAIARRLPSDFTFSYHNHAFEFKTGDFEEFWRLTDPALVMAQLDVGWVYNAGYDPVTWIQMLKGRMPTVHLKDFTDDPANLDAVAGTGRLPWGEILPACIDAEIEFGIIEMDVPPGDPIECVRRSYDFFVTALRSVGS